MSAPAVSATYRIRLRTFDFAHHALFGCGMFTTDPSASRKQLYMSFKWQDVWLGVGGGWGGWGGGSWGWGMWGGLGRGGGGGGEGGRGAAMPGDWNKIV